MREWLPWLTLSALGVFGFFVGILIDRHLVKHALPPRIPPQSGAAGQRGEAAVSSTIDLMSNLTSAMRARERG